LGRYLIAVNSGFGVQFNSNTNRAQQSLSVIDLNARPAPAVIQNVYFPSPQSVNVGLVFSPRAERNGSYTLYAAGGFENKIWMFSFQPGAEAPVSPPSPGPNTTVQAQYIDVTAFATAAPSPNYNQNHAAVYPAGIGISPDGNSLYVANNLGDTLGIIHDLRDARRITRIDLHRDNPNQNIYPYGVTVLPDRRGAAAAKVYVSCWNDASIAVVEPGQLNRPPKFIRVERHPTAMILNRSHSRLYVVNSNADSVSVIDTNSDREIERISVRLGEGKPIGNSPESLALSADGGALYTSNAHTNSLAVIKLSAKARGLNNNEGDRSDRDTSVVRGFIPTGQYPSAVAVAGGRIFVGNGKGTGFQNSSLVVNNSGLVPNTANDRFPAAGRRGQYILSLLSGNFQLLAEPDERTLAEYTQQVMRNNGLIGERRTSLFRGPSPIKHVIYIIKENRTYDQIFGDLERAGDGAPADGDPNLAIFGAGEAARLPGGQRQTITPNHRALALRFGLLDRFFVNSEASPDGHNWSTAAFSSDYVDKASRWDYSRRGRTYDYEGFNRLPDYEPPSSLPPVFELPVAADDVAGYMRRFVPYLNGSRDVAEPETLYLWDAAARAGLAYRNYGEFIATVSEADVAAINSRRPKAYPDISPVVSAFPTKKSLEGHFSSTFPNYDISTPDSMTVESYRAAKQSEGQVQPVISRNHPNAAFRGVSRLGEWLDEFQGYVEDLRQGKPDRLPNLTILRFPNDHTAGLRPGSPTPQFYVAENDYAVGRLVEAVSNSPYWKDTAIFVIEDDAQDGPDHVDAHRSPALVISAYNRPGVLIHEFHNTVSLIRTIEILLGIEPMNLLDAMAVPIDIFQEEPDLRPYTAILPDVSLDNLITRPGRDAVSLYWMKQTEKQNMAHADMADPHILNQVIWFSVRGAGSRMPEMARLPVFDAMCAGIAEDDDEEREERAKRNTKSRDADD
jgi:YVTN family beta-propeller protein